MEIMRNKNLKSNDSREKPKDEGNNNLDYRQLAIEYYELANLLELSDSRAERMIQILEAAQNDNNLNFIINEIDYIVAQKNNLFNLDNYLISKLELNESGFLVYNSEDSKEEYKEHVEKSINDNTSLLLSKRPSKINMIDVGVYECEIHLKFRLIEEKSLLSDREQLLQVLLDALTEGSDDFLETLQASVKVQEISEFKAAPQMRKTLMRLRNSLEYRQTLHDKCANNKA